MPDWEEALETEHQRQAKLIVMEAIAAAERRGMRKGWEMCRQEFEKHGTLVVDMPFPEPEKE